MFPFPHLPTPCVPLWRRALIRPAHIRLLHFLSDMDRPKRKRKRKRAAAAVACPPDDALVEILSRLPAKPLFRFKCASKAWRDLIADRLHRQKFPQTLKDFSPATARTYMSTPAISSTWRGGRFRSSTLPSPSSSCHGLRRSSSWILAMGSFSLNVSTTVLGDQNTTIVAVGEEGRPSRTMHLPANRHRLVFIGQSQGHLHCLSGCMGDDSPQLTELSTTMQEKWVLRDNVSFSHLFGRMSAHFHLDWNVVTIRPDRSLVFFVQHWNQNMISYDMDSKEVDTLCTLGHHRQSVTPYVPYFTESAALAKNH